MGGVREKKTVNEKVRPISVVPRTFKVTLLPKDREKEKSKTEFAQTS
jgi:hypothetical protein